LFYLSDEGEAREANRTDVNTELYSSFERARDLSRCTIGRTLRSAFGRVSVSRAEGQVSANVQKLAALVSWVVGARSFVSPPAPVGATAQVQKTESAPLRLGRLPPSPSRSLPIFW
jgi:hypothetical protein